MFDCCLIVNCKSLWRGHAFLFPALLSGLHITRQKSRVKCKLSPRVKWHKYMPHKVWTGFIDAGISLSAFVEKRWIACAHPIILDGPIALLRPWVSKQKALQSHKEDDNYQKSQRHKDWSWLAILCCKNHTHSAHYSWIILLAFLFFCHWTWMQMELEMSGFALTDISAWPKSAFDAECTFGTLTPIIAPNWQIKSK